jgi:hypothetical protein
MALLTSASALAVRLHRLQLQSAESNDIIQSLLRARSTPMRQASKVARPLDQDQDQDQDQVNLVTPVAAPRAVSASESLILSHKLIQ